MAGIDSTGRYRRDPEEGKVAKKAVAPTRFVVEVGLVAGRLTVLALVGSSRQGRLWRCRCTCGAERVVAAGQLRRLHDWTKRWGKVFGGCEECCREKRLERRPSGRRVSWCTLSKADLRLAREIGMTPSRGKRL